MKTSFGSTLFQMFDKVIVAVLAVLALYYLAMTLVQERGGGERPEDVKQKLEQIDRKQQDSVHQKTPLEADYLTRTVGEFHPDARAVRPRPFLLGGSRGVVVPTKDPYRDLALKFVPGAQEQTPATRELPDEHADGSPEVADPAVARAEIRDGTLSVWPVGEGETAVRVLRAGALLGRLVVRVQRPAERPPEILAPKGLTAVAVRGQVQLKWRAAETVNARVTEYRIYKGEEPTALKPYVRILIPETGPLPLLPSILADTMKPGPRARHADGQFQIEDARVTAGVTLWYALDATGKSREEEKTVTSERSGPVAVLVKEPFRIRFHSSFTRDTVNLEVEVLHEPAEGDAPVRLRKRFRVQPGQLVGRRVPEHREPGTGRFRNVDFSTGYLVLDILGSERRITEERVLTDPATGEVIGKAQQADRDLKKVLLINERGLIKVIQSGPEGPAPPPEAEAPAAPPGLEGEPAGEVAPKAPEGAVGPKRGF
jgi:hypothetical protein